MRRFLWLVPVVLIPLAGLLVIQYRFLRSLERTTALAQRNILRTSLEEVAGEMEDQLTEQCTHALEVDATTMASPALLATHLVKHPVPGVKTYFFYRFDQETPTILSTAGLPKSPVKDEADAIRTSSAQWGGGRAPLVPMRGQTIDQRDHNNRIVLHPVMDGGGHVIGVTGLVFDTERSRRSIQEIAYQKLRTRLHDSYLVVRVDDERMMWAPRTNDHNMLTQSAGFAFSDWRIGLRDACATPEELAASNFRINALWAGGAALVLLAAILLAMQAAARQMHLSQMKSDFVSNVSHELRTPLSSIRVFGEYMRLGRVEKPEKVREYGEYIEAESRRLTQLINNILDFSRIESSQKKYQFEQIDLADLTAETVAAFQLPLRDRGVSVQFRRQAGACLIQGDREALVQALMNLLDNALKYSGEGKSIEVELTSTATDVRVSVVDHGIGIPASEQKKIFDKFYRVGSGLVHDVKGSGLGLAIVSHIAKAHGGRIEVISTPGEGSVFTMVIAACRIAAKAAQPGSALSQFPAEEQA